MWLFAMFDLPVTTAEARKRYAEFRKMLLQQGFTMLQFSVYARYCAGEEMADAVRARIRTDLPPEGYVRLLAVTDRQFGKMESFIGEMSRCNEETPAQLVLF
jgi:CRISPR-associated protein Cas2